MIRTSFRRIRTLVTVALLLGASLCFASTPKQLHQRFVHGRILLKFKDGVSESEARSILAETGARSRRRISLIGVHIVELSPGADKECAEAFQELNEEAFAEMDRMLLPSGITPNDTFYPFEVYFGDINAAEAWSVTTGLSSITVARIDTSVWSSHPDLHAKMAPGWDVSGVAGVCWGCTTMPVRVSDTSGNAWDSDIACSVTWAADHGAKIANLSYADTNRAIVSSADQCIWSKCGITVSYAANTNDSGNTSGSLAQTVQTVGKSSTTTTLTSSLNTSASRQSVTFTATGSTLGSSTLSGGKATQTVNPASTPPPTISSFAATPSQPSPGAIGNTLLERSRSPSVSINRGRRDIHRLFHVSLSLPDDDLYPHRSSGLTHSAYELSYGSSSRQIPV
ncbi:MAG: S8 family serine peptidase, partial [Bryobacteraceae bacterium]